jgi:MarR family transcriptional regulator, organic hydroperoxide resistance regulator
MRNLVNETITFVSRTLPEIYSCLYLDYLKLYSPNYNVNKTQLRALIFIKNNGPKSMTELCLKLNIEKGSLTSMIDDLSNKGYVVRERDLDDRRKYLINLTEKGNEVAEECIDKFTNGLEEKLSKLSEEDRSDYLNSIIKMQEIMEKNKDIFK